MMSKCTKTRRMLGLLACLLAVQAAYGEELAREAAAEPEETALLTTARCGKHGRSCGSKCPDRGSSYRFMVYNIEDLRTEEISAVLAGDTSERSQMVRDAATMIAVVNPDVLFVQELEYDGFEHHVGPVPPTSADNLGKVISQIQSELGREGVKYSTFQKPSNTGTPSGFDLDKSREVNLMPGNAGYARDSFGFGMFRGQYGMAVLVRDPVFFNTATARTFQTFRWADMPGALFPMGDGTKVPLHQPWFTPEEVEVYRLSSKSHWDVPVVFPDGTEIRVWASHPTPPIFDGPEDLNGKRSNDEVRFWAEYLSGVPWIYDDEGKRGGANISGAAVNETKAIIMGDLNNDPLQGDNHNDPIGHWLFNHPLLQAYTPKSKTPGECSPRAEVTHLGGCLRLDYLVPTTALKVVQGGVLQGMADLPCDVDAKGLKLNFEASDHSSLWADLQV